LLEMTRFGLVEPPSNSQEATGDEESAVSPTFG
jgi:hypothetical protein